MNNLTKAFFKKDASALLARSLSFAPQRSYHFPPDKFGMVADKVMLISFVKILIFYYSLVSLPKES